jgi:hypothetical protein
MAIIVPYERNGDGRKNLKNQGLDPVLVIFFEGLIGPGGFV